MCLLYVFIYVYTVSTADTFRFLGATISLDLKWKEESSQHLCRPLTPCTQTLKAPSIREALQSSACQNN